MINEVNNIKTNDFEEQILTEIDKVPSTNDKTLVK